MLVPLNLLSTVTTKENKRCIFRTLAPIAETAEPWVSFRFFVLKNYYSAIEICCCFCMSKYFIWFDKSLQTIQKDCKGPTFHMHILLKIIKDYCFSDWIISLLMYSESLICVSSGIYIRPYISDKLSTTSILIFVFLIG